jgi:hypothetical protein
MNGLVTIKKFAEASGYSEDAIRAKIKNGTWLFRKHFFKGPDGRITIKVEEVNKWLENTGA